jgi:RND family efflux transporter MFP subunit
MMKPYQLIVAQSVLAVSIFMAGCGKSEKAAVAAAPIRVSVYSAATASIPRLCDTPANVAARDSALVSARVSGYVARADLAIGQRVQKGDTLVTLSAPEFGARVNQAQAALDKADRDYARESALLASGATTGQTVREMEERRRMAEAALSEAETMASYATISAPFDGRITKKLVNVGDYAGVGAPLFELDGTSGLRAEASIPESFPEIPLGTRLILRSDGGDVECVLAESSPAADPKSRTRFVKADIPNDAGLRSGQFVRLLWPVGTLDELLVPKSAVSRFGQIERVFVVGNGVAHLAIVRTGETHGDMVQILAGIADGDLVIVNAPSNIENGANVEIAK